MKNKHLKVLVIVLSVLLVAAITTLVIFLITKNEDEKKPDTNDEVSKDFDYLGADLSKYITLSENDYQSNTVTLGTNYLITDELVQQYIDDECFKNRKKENGGNLITDQPIKRGDSAFIYYTGYLNGEKFEGGSNATDKYSYELVIGSGSFIDGFEDGLIGVIPDETSQDNPHVLHLTFPKDYKNADLAGKSVIFEVWVEYTIQYSIPEFNDEFVATALKYNGTAEEYRAEVKTNLETTAKKEAESAAVSAILNKLIEKSKVLEYPEESVDYWYARYIEQYEYYMQYYAYYYGYSFSSIDEFIVAYLGLGENDDWKAITVDYAKEVVRNNLIYYTIAEQQGLSVTEEEYKKGVKALAEYYSNESQTYTEESIVKEVGEAQIRQNILFDKVDDYLLEHCTIEYKDAE